MNKKTYAIILMALGLLLFGYNVYSLVTMKDIPKEELIAQMKDEFAKKNITMPEEQIASSAEMGLKIGKGMMIGACILGALLAGVGYSLYRKHSVAETTTVA